MTDEEIKQKAEEYAKKHETIINYYHDEPETDFEDKKNTYIAGAHSRDREVMDLEHLLKAERTTNKVLAETNEKLRNPWISVKYKLPDKALDNRMGHLTEDSNIVLAVSSSGKLFSNLYYNYHLHEWLEKGAGLNGVDRVLQYYKITHWMPIPELKKGE